jgi:hypothetical protein
VRPLLFASLFLLIPALTASSVRAADCGNITAQGVCQDAKTLVFCEEGELEVIRCPTGELCVTEVDRFNGAAGCIATRYAGCGAVPEQGLCAGSTLLYCANGRVEEFECPSGTRCQDVNYGDYIEVDCVTASSTSSSSADNNGTTDGTGEEPVQPGDDSDGTDNPTPVETSDGAPLPSVETGGAGPAADYDATGAGCDAGGGASALALLVLMALRGRRPRP